MNSLVQSNTYQQLVKLLSDYTGNNLTDITPESLLQDDLGIDLEVTFPKLLVMINQEFSQNGDQCDLRLYTVLETLDEYGETVTELVKIIEEEKNLG